MTIDRSDALVSFGGSGDPIAERLLVDAMEGTRRCSRARTADVGGWRSPIAGERAW